MSDPRVTVTIDNTTLVVLRMIRDSAAQEPPEPNEDMGGVEMVAAAKTHDRWNDLDHAGKLLGAWRSLRVLTEAGFEARSVAEVTTDDRLPREFFVGRRRHAATTS